VLGQEIPLDACYPGTDVVSDYTELVSQIEGLEGAYSPDYHNLITFEDESDPHPPELVVSYQ